MGEIPRFSPQNWRVWFLLLRPRPRRGGRLGQCCAPGKGKGLLALVMHKGWVSPEGKTLLEEAMRGCSLSPVLFSPLRQAAGWANGRMSSRQVSAGGPSSEGTGVVRSPTSLPHISPSCTLYSIGNKHS